MAPTKPLDTDERHLKVHPTGRLNFKQRHQANPTKPWRHSNDTQRDVRNLENTSPSVVGSRVSKKKRNENREASINAAKDIIRVFVNNRLGTRKEILCSPSDTIRDFKKLAALQLGTNPEAIMLKRQGQRPLKNFLTLEDYEIGGGSSLDLEVDTAD